MTSSERSPKPNRENPMNRRRFVEGAAGATLGLALGAYVKPDLRSLGVPGALAVVSPIMPAGASGGTDDPEPSPNGRTSGPKPTPRPTIATSPTPPGGGKLPPDGVPEPDLTPTPEP